MRSRWQGIAAALLTTVACNSTEIGTGRLVGNALGNDFYPQELAFIRADSEVFDAVVRAQLAGTRKDYPYHYDNPRFDSRPYGSDSAYRPYSNEFELEDSTFLAVIRRPVLARIIENRKSVLRALSVTEGGPRPFPGCPGFLVVPRVSPQDSTYERKLRELRAQCPKESDIYFHVGLPLRGVPASIRKPRYGKAIDPAGEAWTTVVEGSYLSSGGGMWDMHAWVMQRDATGRLKLFGTMLLGIIE